MHALVTGGAGFIGSALAELLLSRDAEVVVFDDLSSGYLENVPEGAKFVEGDVRNLDAVTAAMAGCDVVFHQAAHRAVHRR
jgi:UDP-glucose 4-epimerase